VKQKEGKIDIMDRIKKRPAEEALEPVGGTKR